MGRRESGFCENQSPRFSEVVCFTRPNMMMFQFFWRLITAVFLLAGRLSSLWLCEE